MNPINITEDLIRFQTVAGRTKEFEKCLNYIEEQFDSALRLEKFEKEGEKSLLISRGEKPRILLHGHMDVVEAEEEMFEPETKDERIYGRGAADMKSGVACMMKVINEMEGNEVALLLTSDEERGGFKGTGHVIEEENLEPELVISGEPDDSGKFPSIVTHQKGVLQVKLQVEGDSAHASKPEKGENAAEKLLEKYKKIRKLFDHRKEFSTTVNLGDISVEGPINKVPNSASLKLDIRYSNQYNKQEILTDLENIGDTELEVLAQAPMMSNNEEEKSILELKRAAEEITARKVRYRKESFASDMRFFTEREVPAVCFGPEGYDLHGEDEYVEIESMREYCDILKNFLERIEL